MLTQVGRFHYFAIFFNQLKLAGKAAASLKADEAAWVLVLISALQPLSVKEQKGWSRACDQSSAVLILPAPTEGIYLRVHLDVRILCSSFQQMYVCMYEIDPVCDVLWFEHNVDIASFHMPHNPTASGTVLSWVTEEEGRLVPPVQISDYY